MADPIWNERSRKLQQSFSNSSLPSLPMMVPRPALKEKYHKLQRFGVSSAGRTEKSEIVRPKIKNFCLNEQLRVMSNTQDIYKKKHELVREWETLEEEERIRQYAQPQPSNGASATYPTSNQDEEASGDMAAPGSLNASQSTPNLSTQLRLPPRWVAFDREVLRYYMYFKEAVHESPSENFRVRKCLLLYYMNDCTIQIEEPKEQNSGLPQGVFLKRTALFKDDGARYLPTDFAIGDEHTIYGRRFRIVDMDAKTRNFLEEQDIPVGDPEPYPLDSFAQRKLDALKPRPKIESIAGSKPPDTLGQYLKNDKKILKFNCVWDDTDRLYGERNEYSLHYFLSDDTIEVRNKSKGEAFPLLLKRQKLLRNMDRPDLGYYSSKDIICGEFLNCYKRQLLVLSCDAFTEKFYERVHGIKQNKVRIKQSPRPVVKNELPPYNGFGSEADSLANCISLIPKAVKQDLHQFLNNRGKELRFRAKLVHPEPEEVDRRFVITYFMDDDTMAIYEPPQRNSGIVGGKFLERGKYKLRQLNDDTDPVDQLQQLVYDKIQSRAVGGPYNLLRAFKNFGADESGFIDFDHFKIGLRNVGIEADDIPDEQIFLLFKRYDTASDDRINYQEFIDNVMQNKKSTTSKKSDTKLRWYNAADFYVGAKVRFVFSRTGAQTQEFEIVGADSTTFELMESNPRDFARSDINAIASKLVAYLAAEQVAVREVFRELDPEDTGTVSVETFQKLLDDWTRGKSNFTNQESVSLVRHFQNGNDGISYKDFCDLIHSKLTSDVPEESNVDPSTREVLQRLSDLRASSNMRKLFRAIDKDNSGTITWNEFRQLLWNNNLELTDDEIAVLIARFDATNEGYLMNYGELCNVLYGTILNPNYISSEASAASLALEQYNSSQKRLKTPTMAQYKDKLLRYQKEQDINTELRELMKSFSAGYYVRKMTLRKNFLAFDLDNKGTIGRHEFEEALIRTNSDFSKRLKAVLLNYFFPDPEYQLDYDEFMTIMFKHDIMSATRKYGNKL